MQQIVRGYLCGSNDKKWTSHAFANTSVPRSPNNETYFYRFEFQERGTAHLHLLVWLTNVSRIKKEIIIGDIPWCNGDMAYLIHHLQRSDHSSLPLKNTATTVTKISGRDILQIYHSTEAFTSNLRGYISTLLPSLKCRMDFQTTDGRGMLPRYVTSYVSKWQDAYTSDALYSVHISPLEAAYRHVKEMKPLQRGMWLAMSSRKIAWTPSRRQKYVVRRITYVEENTTHTKYCQRPRQADKLSLLEWLRKYDHSKQVPTIYRQGVTLVGLNTLSPLKDEYFFQYLLLHVAHRSTASFFHRDYESLPPQMKFFVAAMSIMPHIWRNDQEVLQHFRNEGHRDYFVTTVVAHIASLRDFYVLWQRQVLARTPLQSGSTPALLTTAVPEQMAVLHTVETMLRLRDQFYNSIDCIQEEEDDEEELPLDGEQGIPQNEEMDTVSSLPCARFVDWRKFLMLSGKPGTGKSHLLMLLIRQCIDQHRPVLMATPTGFLASTYRSAFPNEIAVDTIHSAFQYPVLQDEAPSINWNLADHDIIVIDELSMVSSRIFQHIITTVNNLVIRPVIVLCGDECQQQPIETVENVTRQAQSAMHNTSFRALFHRHNLTTQHRSNDEDLTSLLNHIRHWRPSPTLLQRLQHGRLLCNENIPTDEDLLQAILSHPTATVLTVTRIAAKRINTLMISHIFSNEDPLAVISCDNNHDNTPIYQDLKVMITQNRDKEHGIVNGQLATVHTVQNNTVFLRLPNGNIVHTHPVTSTKQDGTLHTVFPFMPSYSITICKSQGQTISSVILWFDVATVPPGSGYVALSRVKKLADIFFLTPLHPHYFKPVEMR